MNAAPAISVLMSVYNGSIHVRKAIDSISRQSFRDFEFIVIDDASTDDSLQVVESISDDRIRIVRNETNCGLAKSLNKGLDIARGKYIARIDADDVAAPDRLSRQYFALEADSSLVLVGSCGYFYHGDTGMCEPWDVPLTDFSIRMRMCYENPFIHSSVILRRETIEAHQLRYDESFSCAQDYDLWARLSDYGRMLNLPDRLVTFHWHSRNISLVRKAEQSALAVDVAASYLAKIFPELTPQDARKIDRLPFLCSDNELRQAKRLISAMVRHSCVDSKDALEWLYMWTANILDKERFVKLLSHRNRSLLGFLRSRAMLYTMRRLVGKYRHFL